MAEIAANSRSKYIGVSWGLLLMASFGCALFLLRFGNTRFGSGLDTRYYFALIAALAGGAFVAVLLFFRPLDALCIFLFILPIFSRLKEILFYRLGPLYLTVEPTIIGLLLLRVLLVQVNEKRALSVVPKWAQALQFLFVVAAIPSVMSSILFDLSLTSYWEGILAPSLLLIVVTTLIRNQEQLTRVLWATLGGGLISIGYGLYQYYLNPGWRISSVYYSPAIFGQVLAFYVPLGLALAFLVRNFAVKTFLLAIVMLSLAVVLLCVTRTDYFIVPFGLGLFLVFRLPLRRLVTTGILGILLLTVMLVAFAPLHQNFVRYLYFQDPLMWLDPGSSGAEHLLAWKASLSIARDLPWGIGPSMFKFYYWHYQPPSGILQLEMSHNLFLEGLCELGWVAGLAFSALFAGLCWHAYRSVREAPREQRTVLLFCLSSLLCFGASAFVGGSFVHLHIANPIYYFWLVAGLLFVCTRMEKSNAGNPRMTEAAPGPATLE